MILKQNLFKEKLVLKKLWLLLLLPASALAMENQNNPDIENNIENNNDGFEYVQPNDEQNQQQNPINVNNINQQQNIPNLNPEQMPVSGNSVNKDHALPDRVQRWYNYGFDKTGKILNRMTGNGGEKSKPTTWERLISMGSGFALPFYFAATSKVPFRRLPGYAFKNIIRNMAVGTLLFGGASAINGMVGAGILGGNLNNESENNLQKARLVGKLSASFLDKEVSLASFFIEQLVHPVFLSSCLGGGLWAPALMNVMHAGMTPSMERNRAHRAGIMAGLISGLLWRYRGKVYTGVKQELGSFFFS